MSKVKDLNKNYCKLYVDKATEWNYLFPFTVARASFSSVQKECSNQIFVKGSYVFWFFELFV